MYNVQYIFYNEILYNLMYSFGLNPQPVTVTTWVSQKNYRINELFHPLINGVQYAGVT